MTAILWTPQLDTGIPFVDADHRILVKLLNQIDDAIAMHEDIGTLGSVLGALSDYTIYHFDREEAMLEACGYQGLGGHQDEHAHLSGQVADIARRFRADPGGVAGAEVREFLRSWLVEHIMIHDFAYCASALVVPAAADRAEAIHFGQSMGLKQNGFAAMRVMVVDDSARFRAFLATLLKALGVRDVTLAASGEEAMDRWTKRPGDAVICDWIMDGMPPHALAAAIRTFTPAAKVIALSGLSLEMIEAQAGAGTIDAILEKPVAARDLARALVAH
ncbi:MAG: bacteriohemerythrin [Alphaproteobacteria bacterium]|nr:bacteriohemerythrin [Alphaproteobacteria bacterium]